MDKNATQPGFFQRIRSDLRALYARLSYRALLSNIPFMAYLAFLGMLYITNNNRAVQIQQELNKQQVVLKELRWRHMDARTRLMSAGREEDVIRRAEPLALKPLTLPPYALKKHH